MIHVQAEDGLEALLLAEGNVTDQQIERARRIASRMQRPRPLGEILVELGQLARAEYDRLLRQHRSRLTIAEILHEEGALDADRLAAYQAACAESPARSDRDALVRSGWVTEEQFLGALATRHDIPFIEPEVGLVDMGVLGRASFPYLIRQQVLPLRISEGSLSAILADPLDPDVLGELERIYGVPVTPCCAVGSRIVDTLRTLENLRAGAPSSSGASLQYLEVEEVAPSDPSGDGAVAILDYLLVRALQLRASDLHIEPLRNKVRVRARIDGVLQPLTDLPGSFAAQLTSRVKVLAGADIAERRLHQDGRIRMRTEQREVDLRVSSYASVHGETVVLRLLDHRRGLLPIDELGLQPRVLTALRDALRSSSGLLMTTGPTGSGKTTTLYSLVDYVATPQIKVITCEDPVEYVIDGLTQCSVNAKSGPTFAESLRAMLRQDPDVIVVGEVRDRETAALAVEAALTGHLVLSTFHTEDAVGTAVRLVDMGIEPFLIASTLSCVVGQRLIRRVCPECRRPAEASREDLRFLGLERADLASVSLVQGAGCAACNGTGFNGRIGVHEILMPDDDFRDAMLRRAPSRELRALARRLPTFLTLQESGILRAAAGATTLSEIAANVPRDRDCRRLVELHEIAGSGRTFS